MILTVAIGLHVLAGALGLTLGAVALTVRKGNRIHKLAGNGYVIAMLMMAISGVILAYLRDVSITMLAGSLSLYLVSSSWLTLKRSTLSFKYAEHAVLLIGVCVSVFGLVLSVNALGGDADKLGKYSVPAGLYLVFSSVAIVAVIADMRWLMTTAPSLRLTLIRHIWRMCMPLYIGASAFFNGQADVFPKSIRSTGLLDIPEMIVVLAMLFWIVKSSFQSRKLVC